MELFHPVMGPVSAPRSQSSARFPPASPWFFKRLSPACNNSNNSSKVGVTRSQVIWFCGLACLIIGEVLTVAAFTYAPAVLVSPLGAFRVIVTAILRYCSLRLRYKPDDFKHSLAERAPFPER